MSADPTLDEVSAWVESQTYLNPYPAELMLRNAV